MRKNRFSSPRFRAARLMVNWFILTSLILASCSGIPGISTPTPVIPTPTFLQQAAPPAIIETDPPEESVIGHLSPITFYFNQPMNQASVEPSFSGLPPGAYVWRDESTLLYTPAQPYPPNSQLKISIGASVQSATGFGLTGPIELSYTVADFLRLTNLLPQADASDVNVNAAIAASFNQPVVPLGGDPASQPAAFSIQPPVQGNGEWINTSTYIFYPGSSMHGAAEYTVSLNPALKTASGVGLALSEAEGVDGSGQSAWRFVTARPRVVELIPSHEGLIAPDAEITLIFNQPMDEESVQSNFLLSGTDGQVSGTYTWNDESSELTFKPDAPLARGIGHLLNVNADARSRGGTPLGEDYGAVLNTYPEFDVAKVEPFWWSTNITFTAPLAEGEYDNAVTFSPPVENLHTFVEGESRTILYLNGTYLPETEYTIEINGTTQDRWGQTLGEPFVSTFTTPPLPPALDVYLFSSGATFVRPDEPVLFSRAVNVTQADVAVAPLALQDFFSLQNSYEAQQAYAPVNPTALQQTFDLPSSQWQDVTVNLTPGGNPLATGLYYVSVTAPQGNETFKRVILAASSHVNLTFKRGATEALIWAVDLRTQDPVVNAPVTIYDGTGTLIGSGVTDANGLWEGPIEVREGFGPVYGMLNQPGEETFALAISDWSWYLNGWNFGYAQNVQAPHTRLYMYTDRPIYRPGHTMYFRLVARQAFNGRYELPAVNELPLTLRDPNGITLKTFNAQFSPNGTFGGELELPGDATPGYYTFENSALEFYFSFQVAEYRKPEIDLGVDFSSDELEFGDAAQATMSAQYFFGAPAGDAEVHWSLYATRDHFSLPGYETGLIRTSWVDAYALGDSPFFGGLIAEGTDRTNPQGILSIELPALPESESGQLITLEATIQDESGFPVSARSELRVHPADYYIGIQPDNWVGRARSAVGFDIVTVDWAKNPSGDKPLMAEFKQVRWERETDEFGFSNYTPVYTPVSSSNLVTGPEGRARLSFIPPNAGTFMLEVSGDGVRAQAMIWVSGAGTAEWPDLPNDRLEITADKDAYQPGDTATIFIPNPFETDSRALISVERGVVFKSEIVTLSGSGREFSLPLTDDDAPNVYVSVTVLGQGNEFRQGLVNLPVAPDAQALNVQVTSDPEQAGPRESVTFDVLVTDHQGQPVQGEFSLAVVDLAALRLADPNAEDILPAFYSIQPLGIETGISLAAYSGRGIPPQGGGGGGGDGGIIFLREEFPDTAYWNPALITNSEGRGQVTVTLPDSLTTWHVDVRGLTVDTKVGQTEMEIVSTKPLLVRPVTPRFLVSGDHVLMAAIVNNNTSNRLTATVSLQSKGFVLDEPENATQEVDIPARGRVRVEWWGTASLAESAELIFSATSTGNPSLQDSTRPVWGTLPILQHTSPQAFVTGGVLREAATQQEVISLPRTFSPTSGGLEVELSPSLAGSLTSALEAMPGPDENSAESIVSFLIPNLEVYRALSDAGLNDPKLVERVEANLNSSVSRLFYLQNQDGGWDWWGRRPVFFEETGSGSDPVISAYVFFGLLRAREAGAPMNEEALQRAGAFLRDRKAPFSANPDAKYFDHLAFVQFALAHAGTFNEAALNQLYETRDRMSPSGISWLAIAISRFNAADPRVRDLISALDASAILSSSSAYWESPGGDFFTQSSTVYTTSTVVYALAQLDAGNPNLPNAVRYLAAHRDANKMWNLGHDNAWAILALNAALVGLGEIRADFKFDATLNGGPLTSGDIAGIQVTPFTATVPLEFLSPNSPNLLIINREAGLGRLYYNATLQLNRPVQDVKPLDKGMRIDRVYLDPGCTGDCQPLSSFRLDPDQSVTAQLTLTLPHDAYYVMIEDFIPAGTEILDQNLKTSQLAIGSTEVQVQFDDEDPFADGWGWWLFNPPQIRDDRILFTADFLPAGTYVLTYTLTPLQEGEFRVLPAHAWQALFPEVQGTSAGMVVEVKP